MIIWSVFLSALQTTRSTHLHTQKTLARDQMMREIIVDTINYELYSFYDTNVLIVCRRLLAE